jgi:hypothetical protein
VFVRSAGKWSQQADLTASDAAAEDRFGRSVAISGSTAVVGGPGTSFNRGAAYVFAHNTTGWSQQAKLTPEEVLSEHFGASVAVDGSTAVVGAPFKHLGTGAAYVFVRSAGKWSQQAELTALGGAAGDRFGSSVAISGSTAVLGAPLRHSGTGAAYVFANV